MYKDPIATSARDLAQYVSGAIEICKTRLERGVNSRPKVVTGSSLLCSALCASPDNINVSTIRKFLIAKVEDLVTALRGYSKKAWIAKELQQIPRGKRTTIGIIEFARKLRQALVTIERNFNLRADFTYGCIWNLDDPQIVAPEYRLRLDGSKIQEPKTESLNRSNSTEPVQGILPIATCVFEIAALDNCDRGIMSVINPFVLEDLRNKEWIESSTWRLTKAGRTALEGWRATEEGQAISRHNADLDVRLPEYNIINKASAVTEFSDIRLPEHEKECLDALGRGAQIPKEWQYTASEAIGLRKDGSGGSACTRERPFGQCTRYLSDGTPVGHHFVSEVLTRLSEAENPFNNVDDPIGFWVARSLILDHYTSESHAHTWTVVKVVEAAGSKNGGANFIVIESGKPDSSNVKSWVFGRKLDIRQ